MALGMTKITNAEVFSTIVIANGVLEWASEESEGTEINVSTSEQVIDCMLQVEITFGGAPDDTAELHLRYSNDEGTTLDTEEVKTFATSIDEVTSSTIIYSYRIPGMFDYLDVGIKNNDGSETISCVVSATYTKLTGLEIS